VYLNNCSNNTQQLTPTQDAQIHSMQTSNSDITPSFVDPREIGLGLGTGSGNGNESEIGIENEIPNNNNNNNSSKQLLPNIDFANMNQFYVQVETDDLKIRVLAALAETVCKNYYYYEFLILFCVSQCFDNGTRIFLIVFLKILEISNICFLCIFFM